MGALPTSSPPSRSWCPPHNGRYLRAPGVFRAGKRGRRWVCAEHCLCAGNLPSGALYSNPAREGRFAHLIDEETEARRWAMAQLGPGLGGRSPASQQPAHVTPEVAGPAHPLPKGTVPLAQSCSSLGLFENSRSLRGGGWGGVGWASGWEQEPAALGPAQPRLVGKTWAPSPCLCHGGGDSSRPHLSRSL